jgi:hypothetical protein
VRNAPDEVYSTPHQALTRTFFSMGVLAVVIENLDLIKVAALPKQPPGCTPGDEAFEAREFWWKKSRVPLGFPTGFRYLAFTQAAERLERCGPATNAGPRLLVAEVIHHGG